MIIDVKSCLTHIRWKIDRHPRRADLWNTLALVLARDGETAEAISALDTALRINPEFTNASRLRCFLLADSGRVDEAFRDFKRLQVRDPDGFETLFSLGVFCMKTGWIDVGLTLLKRAEKVRPRVPYVLMHVAAAFREAADEDAAESRLARARDAVSDLPLEEPVAGIDPSMLESLTSWECPNLVQFEIVFADFLAQSGEADRAREELLRANARCPGHARLMIELGKAFLFHGEANRAAEWMTAVTRLHHAPHEAHIELGFIHAEAAALREAEWAFQSAIELRPLFPDYRFHFATFLVELGRTEEAIGQLERVLVLNPDYDHAALHLANAYLETGRFDEALETVASSGCATWTEARVLAAEAHWLRGDSDRARELLDGILAAEPRNADAIELLARVTAATPA